MYSINARSLYMHAYAWSWRDAYIESWLYIPYIISFFIEEEKLDNSNKAICDLRDTFHDSKLVFDFEIIVLFIKCNANR